jgi:predicted dehydrogenase
VKTARAANRLLGIDLSYRFTEAMRIIREKIHAGEIGTVYACDLVFHNAYGPDKPWFYERSLSGGGCVIDLGIHVVDLALWTLSFPGIADVSSTLFAKGRPLRDGQVEDYATATFRLNSEAAVHIACSWKLPIGCDAIISADFYGTKGGLSFHNLNGSFYDFVAEQCHGTSRKLLCSPPDAWGGRAAVAWAVELSRNPYFDPEVAHVIEVAKALDTIYAARARN